MSKVNIKVIEIPDVVEVLPVVLEIEKKNFFIGNSIPYVWFFWFFHRWFYFIYINELPTQHRMLIVDDFDFDQMLSENIAIVDPQIQNFNFSQRSQYSSHIYVGILDLLFDNSNSNTVPSFLSPFSDDFFLFYKIWYIIFIQNLAVNNLASNPCYITHKYLCWHLDERDSENLLWKQSPK